MKIVLNACFGGFGLSDEGMRRYLTLKGVAFTERNDQSHWHSQFFSDAECSDDAFISAYDINRTDPALVQTVEELGERANGHCADLVVDDVPAGTHYRIREYDGRELIEYADEIVWEIAQ